VVLALQVVVVALSVRQQGLLQQPLSCMAPTTILIRHACHSEASDIDQVEHTAEERHLSQLHSLHSLAQQAVPTVKISGLGLLERPAVHLYIGL
jgi:hypothetical protein